MAEVVIVAGNGRTLRISEVSAEASDGWTYSAGLRLESGEMSVGVYEHGDPSLGRFFSDLAAEWRGFDGERAYVSLEGQLAITASHDMRGTVTCVVALRQPWPPTWTVEAELDLGAGAHLEGIGSDLTALFAEAEARRSR